VQNGKVFKTLDRYLQICCTKQMVKRISQCELCGRMFESKERGAIPKSCPQCRVIYRKQRYYHYEKKGYALSLRTLNFREALKRANGHCEICFTAGKRLNVHHKDGNGLMSQTPNHSVNNLIVVCARCHMELHKLVKVGNLEKLLTMRQKNMTLQEIGSRYGVSRQRIHQLIKKSKENLTQA